MYKVCSTQFNYKHGKRMHFPYSIAMLVAFLKNHSEVSRSFKFEKSFIFRDKLDLYLKQAHDVDILLCSCYTWNWEITLHMADNIKRGNPNCLVILGGPQVPNNTEGFFEKYPFVDILVHGEGELILSNIFIEYLKNRDYSHVKGITTKNYHNGPESRLNEDVIPSPYLTNVIWELVDSTESEAWATNWETNRGCPYGCTFCDWGAAAFNKTTRYAEDRLFKEIEWFAENKMTYIECCDANFGIFQDRDLRIATKLKESALKTGYPKFFHSAWAKFSSDKIIPIAKQLQAGGLLRDVTLALQSLDEDTLKIVKRANMKFNHFSQLTKSFQENDIPTYTEIIRGLPGETLESFRNGLETVVSDSNISTMYIYNCAIYVNAPMNEPGYKELYKIKTFKSPLYTSHVIIPQKDITEYEEVVVSTKSFTLEELKEMFHYSWCTLVFQVFGIIDSISRYYNKTYGIEFMSMVDYLLKYCKNSNGVFANEFRNFVKYIDDGYDGRGWNHQDAKLGPIVWPIEEASWLRLTYNKDDLKTEIMAFISFFEIQNNIHTPNKIISDLVKFNLYLLTLREEPKIRIEEFEYDWKDFFLGSSTLKECKKRFYYQNKNDEQDPIVWGYNSIWYGRATQQFKQIPKNITENEELFMKADNLGTRKILSP